MWRELCCRLESCSMPAVDEMARRGAGPSSGAALCAVHRLACMPPAHPPRAPPFRPRLQAGIQLGCMWDVYCRAWLPFGALLTDMEAVGMAVDRSHLAAAQQQAQADQQRAQDRFRCGGCLLACCAGSQPCVLSVPPAQPQTPRPGPHHPPQALGCPQGGRRPAHECGQRGAGADAAVCGGGEPGQG